METGVSVGENRLRHAIRVPETSLLPHRNLVTVKRLTHDKFWRIPPCPGWPKYQWWVLRSHEHGEIGFVRGRRALKEKVK